jgi:hypothetical protein
VSNRQALFHPYGQTTVLECEDDDENEYKERQV